MVRKSAFLLFPLPFDCICIAVVNIDECPRMSCVSMSATNKLGEISVYMVFVVVDQLFSVNNCLLNVVFPFLGIYIDFAW